MNRFEEYINSLPLQTLTDELKEEIIEMFNECRHDYDD